MIALDDFIQGFSNTFPSQVGIEPWEVVQSISKILNQKILELGSEYKIKDDIAIYRSAVIEPGAVIKSPVIISEQCFVGANAYLRGGVYLAFGVSIGPSCEVKSSIVFPYSSMGHFNFIGDSIIGNHVNFEAGSLTANHYNERKDKSIWVTFNSGSRDTGVEKFGALVGDGSKIGANSVLSPGTLLKPKTIVERLRLVEQNKRGN
ncbi:LpxA family transferase [Flavobacteriaceae bacterium F89]|uniref:LpxA family transferase n=1 Tax=Cerina litoralis TaxID=2874477 RepID=A0AAE3JR24_9FLAO|nr:LpxA family transferase [Cerina litoralis]MCG2460858.1 LpxA family transferase [Cerina litoralis]